MGSPSESIRSVLLKKSQGSACQVLPTWHLSWNGTCTNESGPEGVLQARQCRSGLGKVSALLSDYLGKLASCKRISGRPASVVLEKREAHTGGALNVKFRSTFAEHRQSKSICPASAQFCIYLANGREGDAQNLRWQDQQLSRCRS